MPFSIRDTDEKHGVRGRGLGKARHLDRVEFLFEQKDIVGIGPQRQLADDGHDKGIVEVEHDRLSSDISAGTAGVYLSLEVQDRSHEERLVDFLGKKGIEFDVLG